MSGYRKPLPASAKPCPICRGRAELDEVFPPNAPSRVSVVCGCGLRFAPMTDTKAELLRRWNGMVAKTAEEAFADLFPSSRGNVEFW